MTTTAPNVAPAPAPGTHTPGPWLVTDASWDENSDVRYTLTGVKLANVSDARLIASAPALAAENARLIALVGELRETLRWLTNAASEVHTLGAVKGTQWARLTGPLIQARAILARKDQP